MKKTTIRIEDELHKKIMKSQDMNNHKMPHKDKKK